MLGLGVSLQSHLAVECPRQNKPDKGSIDCFPDKKVKCTDNRKLCQLAHIGTPLNLLGA
jgi:hypothetical protein